MRTIIWFIYFGLYLVVLCPKLLWAKKLTRDGKQEQADAVILPAVGRWARSLVKLAGAKVEITGLENVPDCPAVFVGNHQGNFDIPILLGFLPKPYAVLSKKEVASLPFIKSWMLLFGCVFVDRKDPRQSVAAINEAAEVVRGGRSMIIFPEGTRSRGETVGEFKSGAFKIAAKTLVPVVPIAMSGSYKIMEQNGSWIKPATVTIKILPPIKTADMTREQLRELEGNVRDIIIKEKGGQ